MGRFAIMILSVGLLEARSQTLPYFKYYSTGYAYYSQNMLPAPYEFSFTATGVNNVGTVVGFSNLTTNDTNHAFSYTNGNWTDLGALFGADVSRANGVNNNGTIVGVSYTANGTTYHAFSYSDGVMTDLGSLSGSESNSYATAINDAGTIVGAYFSADGTTYRAFSYSNGTMTDIGTLGGPNSVALGINNSGTIVGWANVASGAYHAFSYRNGAMTDLGTLGGTNSQAAGINNLGVIVGSSDIANGYSHAFIYRNGEMADLGVINQFENYFYATAINDVGTIIGQASKDGVHADFAFEYNTRITAVRNSG